MELQVNLKQLFEGQLPGCQFLPEVSGRRVGGAILWDGFVQMDQLERQAKVRELVRQGLKREADRLRVGLIVTLTPQEYEIIKRESA